MPAKAQVLAGAALTKNAKTDLAGILASFPDLAAVAEAWPDLPGDVRRTILHVVRASIKPEDH